MDYQIIKEMNTDYLQKVQGRFWANVDKRGPDDCWEWQGYGNGKGYGTLWVSGSQCLAHRLSYELNNGPIPRNHHICHSCDNPGCVNPSHLFTGTNYENAIDKVNKGRLVKSVGSNNGFAKLTPNKIRAIRSARNSGKTTVQIADEFGIGTSHVSKIVLRQIWRHI